MAIKWDASALEVTRCQIAKAEVEAGTVRLDFGSISRREDEAIEGVTLRRRIILDEEAATNLLKLLNSMISKLNL